MNGYWKFIMSGGPQSTAVYEYKPFSRGALYEPETKRIELSYLPRDKPMRLVRGDVTDAEFADFDRWMREEHEKAAANWARHHPDYDPLPPYQGVERAE